MYYSFIFTEISFYPETSNLYLFSDVDNVVEFSDICGYYLGKPGEYISIFFSLFALLGATTVYWVLISNFLYHVGSFIYGIVL